MRTVGDLIVALVILISGGYFVEKSIFRGLLKRQPLSKSKKVCRR